MEKLNDNKAVSITAIREVFGKKFMLLNVLIKKFTSSIGGYLDQAAIGQ